MVSTVAKSSGEASSPAKTVSVTAAKSSKIERLLGQEVPQGKSQLMTYLVNMLEAAREIDGNIVVAKHRLKKIEVGEKERVLKEHRAKNKLLAELLQENHVLIVILL